MKLKKLLEIFPNAPDMCEKLWGPDKTVKKIRQPTLVENIFHQEDPKAFLAFVLSQIETAQKSKGTRRQLREKIIRHPLFPAFAPEGLSLIRPIQKQSDAAYGSFPVEALPLRAMRQRAEELSANGYRISAQIIKTIRSDVKKDPRIPRSFDFNRTGRDIPGMKIHMNDVDCPYGRFRLGGCPRSLVDTSSLFKKVLEAGDLLFVSLHEKGEHPERYHDFWENEKLRTLRLDAWTIQKTEEKELARMQTPSTQGKIGRLVESTLIASRGEEKRTLTHIHFDGWVDQSPLPSEDLFYTLQQRITQLCPTPQDPVIINCIGGKGRTGTTAAARMIKFYIDKQLEKGVKLDDITLNIPQDIIYDILRMHRKGMIGQPSHLAHLYAFTARYYEELKAKESK
jgi:hypothetical protein